MNLKEHITGILEIAVGEQANGLCDIDGIIDEIQEIHHITGIKQIGDTYDFDGDLDHDDFWNIAENHMK